MIVGLTTSETNQFQFYMTAAGTFYVDCGDGGTLSGDGVDGNTITINWTGASQSAINATNAGTAIYGGDINTPQSAIHVPGKTFTGWKFINPNK